MDMDRLALSLKQIMKDEEEVEDLSVSVQDQIIIAPEIMRAILKHLDCRQLKQIRLVCKSWLKEAQIHMDRKGIVRLTSCLCVQELLETKGEKIQGLPQPFKLVEANFYTEEDREPSEALIRNLSTLCPPLVLTKFSPIDIPLELVFPFLIKCSSTLKILVLTHCAHREGYVPKMDQIQTFPKLKELRAYCWSQTRSTMSIRRYFPSLIAWIVKASPHLVKYGSWGEFGSELLLKVNLHSVKMLFIYNDPLDRAALKHLIDIPFTGLEFFKFCTYYAGNELLWRDAWLATAVKSTASLRALDFSDGMVDAQVEDMLADFPVCPNVTELTVNRLPYYTNVVATLFPSLQELNICFADMDVFGDLWNSLTPFVGLETLRIKNTGFGNGIINDQLALKFFEKFPALKKIRFETSFLLHCCGLKATGDPRFSNMLEDIKHLELESSKTDSSEPTDTAGYSTLSTLKGVKTLTMRGSNRDIPSIPFQVMPCLKLIQFPWGDCLDMEALLEMARGKEKIRVTNCCSVSRVAEPESKELLNSFFESAPNAECGCSGDKNKNPMNRW